MNTFTEALANLPNEHAFGEWLHAHMVTQAIEVPIYVALLYWAFRRWWIAIPLAVFVNIATHPTLWYLFPYWEPDGSWLLPILPPNQHENAGYFAWLIIAECCVFLVEGHIIAAALVKWGREKHRNAPFAIGYGVLCAFIANVPSTLAGLLS